MNVAHIICDATVLIGIQNIDMGQYDSGKVRKGGDSFLVEVCAVGLIKKDSVQLLKGKIVVVGSGGSAGALFPVRSAHFLY